VDTVTEFLAQEQLGETVYLWFKLPQDKKNLVTWQGSIAVNGVSLTIAKLEDDRFGVALISHTLQETNLGLHKRFVNLEFDIIGKYIFRFLQNQNKPKLTEDWLREKGF
jgi:riboflavin synthase